MSAEESGHCHTFEFGYCCAMVRRVSTVFLSALIGSLLGTLLLFA
jgi:hypothetical protein